MRKIRVLVIDSSIAVRNGLGSIVGSQADMEVIGFAGTGVEGVSRVEQLSPDVVLMDCAMPILDEVEASRRIKTNSPGVGVILLAVQYEDRERAADSGADALLMKDCPRAELFAAIRSQAGQRQAPGVR